MNFCRLNQERQQAHELRQQLGNLQETNRHLHDEIRQLQLQHQKDNAMAAGSADLALKEQVVALKWQLLEATRRAELAEAFLLRNGRNKLVPAGVDVAGFQ